MPDPVKHRGCADCGTTSFDVPVLWSVPVPHAIGSKAVCPACAYKYGLEILEEVSA